MIIRNMGPVARRDSSDVGFDPRVKNCRTEGGNTGGEVVERKNNGSSRLYGGCATIKQHISTPVVRSLVVAAPKYVLLPHRAHSFIVNVQPTLPTTAISVRVEHVNTIVPAACKRAVVVKYPTEPIVRWLRRIPGNGSHDFWTDGTTGILSLVPWPGETKEITVPGGISSSGAN